MYFLMQVMGKWVINNIFKKLWECEENSRILCRRTIYTAAFTFAAVSNAKNDNDARKWSQIKLWLSNEYNEKVTHSSLMRFGRATYAIVSVVLDYKYSLMGIDQQSSQYFEIKSQCHLRSALKFRDLCSMNGGLFMKIAQHIGSLEFLFPKEYTDTLKCFQYQAPASSIDDVRYVIKSETNQTIEELFTEFNPKPIGSASLAQVHQAVLKDGTAVAVKVQHRAVKKYALADAKFIEFFVGIATQLFPEFQFQWLVDQIKENIPLETNFLHEGKNCEKMANMLKEISFLKVPKIYWNGSTERVLLMEYCEGGVVDDLEFIKKNNIDRNDISSKLGRLYSEMIFVQGFIHCDPHPGNILVRLNSSGSTEIVLLDHGLYQSLPNKVRLMYCDLWQSLINSDIKGIKKYSEMLGVGEYYSLFACMVSGRSWQSIQAGIERKSITRDELNEIQSTAVQLVSTITEVLEKLPREMILIFKTNDLLRGLDGRLGTKVSFVTMSKCCIRAKFNHDLSCALSWSQKMLLYVRFSLSALKLWLYGIIVTNYYLSSGLGKMSK